MRAITGAGRYVLLVLVLATTALSLFAGLQMNRSVSDAGSASGETRRAALAADAKPVLDLSKETPRTVGLPDKTVALTFDDGPDPMWTPRVLDVLDRHDVPGTFFVVGSRVLEDPQSLRRQLRGGHAIGVHTFSHSDMASQPAWRNRLELSLTQKALAAAGGVTSNLMRPPYSSVPAAVSTVDLSAYRQGARGYTVVLSTSDSEDWRRPGTTTILQNALPRGSEGAIVLLHDGGGDRAQTVEALDALITRLKADDWRFVTVPEGLRTGASSTREAPAVIRAQGHALRLVQGLAGSVSVLAGLLLSVIAVLTFSRFGLMLYYARKHSRLDVAAQQDASSRQTPRVSVVVPAYNEEVGVAGTVLSLAASNYPDLEIVVVDDGSTDRTADVIADLAETIPGLQLVQQVNAGKAHALNNGVARASGSILVLIDGDTVVEPTTVARLVRPFSDPGVGAVSGNAKVGNRSGLLGRWQHVEYVSSFNLDRRFQDVTNTVNTIPGAVGAFRREVLDEVGGVPADTLTEDTDLTVMIGLAGWRVAYQPDARAWTEAPSDLTSLWRQRYRWAYGLLQVVWKHRAVLGSPAVKRRAGVTTRLGRVGLPYLIVFGFVVPGLAPLVDLVALLALPYGDRSDVALVWGAFVAMQVAMAAYALGLDGESRRPLWALPLQQFVYRQVMYLVIFEAVTAALTGRRLRWHKLARSGTAGVALQGELTSDPYPESLAAPVRVVEVVDGTGSTRSAAADPEGALLVAARGGVN